MSWKQFHFKCRFFLQKINEGSTLHQANESFEQSDLATLYSDKKLAKIQKQLFDRVNQLSSIDDIKRALSVLSSLNLSENLSASSAYKDIIRKLSYLTSIVTTFIVFSSIYRVYVFPVFNDIISQYSAMNDPSFRFIPSYWLLGIAISALMLLFCISSQQYIKNIDRLVIQKPSRFMALFIPKKAKAEITKLHNIISTVFEKNARNGTDKSIDALAKTGLDETYELGALFEHHAERLELIISHYTTRIFTVVSTLVTLGIAYFIMKLYDPIFKLGAIIE